MTGSIRIGDITVQVTRKAIKHVHLSVHPPSGRVTLTAPIATRLDVARAYAISRLGWIRQQQERLKNQARETPRRFIERESHYLWGRRHLLTVVDRDAKPSVSLDHKRIALTVRPGSSAAKRAEVIHQWHMSLLHAVVPAMIRGKYGRIVNIASIAGKEGNPNAAHYSASKAGLIALTKSLGKELAQYDIAVNAVTPAAAKTAIFDQITQEHIDYMLSKIPRNRFVKVEELAAMVAWMASEENSFTTGAVFDISGGRATY